MKTKITKKVKKVFQKGQISMHDKKNGPALKVGEEEEGKGWGREKRNRGFSQVRLTY